MIAVWSEQEATREGRLLAARLQIPLLEKGAAPTPEMQHIFFYAEDSLYLMSLLDRSLKPFRIDYLSEEFLHRVRSSNKNDLFLKACGLKKGNRSVLDASFGLGYDATFLSAFDMLVTACERNVYTYEFAVDALSRLKDEGGFSEVPPTLFLGDVSEYLREYPNERFDVVYFDPMYPEAKKSALTKKEMRIFRDLVGDDQDAKAIFPKLLGVAKDRVVIKRPDDAEPIVPEREREVDIVYPGKSVRFDVYLVGRKK